MVNYLKDISLIEEDQPESTESLENITNSNQPTTEVIEEKDGPVVDFNNVNIVEERDTAVAGSRNGKAQFCFITVGKGASGYYTEDVLKSSAHLFEGRPMYIDHHKGQINPGILYWAGDIESAHYDAKGIDGPGIYGTATVLPRWKDVVEGMVDSKGGVSIKARGKSDENGLIRSISVVESVDYVVRAGRGGRVMELFESAIVSDNEQEVSPKEESSSIEENKENEMGSKLEEAQETPEATPVEESAQTAPSATESSDSSSSVVVNMEEMKKMFTTALDEKFTALESRLSMIERESSDREIVTKAVREAAGEDLTEEMCKHVETVVWQSRREGVDLSEQAKITVESLKPIFAAVKAEADKKVEEATKKDNSNKNVPTILEHMNNAYVGKDDEEVSEEELEKQLAQSISKIVETDNVTRIHETIVNSRGA